MNRRTKTPRPCPTPEPYQTPGDAAPKKTPARGRRKAGDPGEESAQTKLRESLLKAFARLNNEQRAEILGMAEAFLYSHAKPPAG